MTTIRGGEAEDGVISRAIATGREGKSAVGPCVIVGTGAESRPGVLCLASVPRGPSVSSPKEPRRRNSSPSLLLLVSKLKSRTSAAGSGNS